MCSFDTSHISGHYESRIPVLTKSLSFGYTALQVQIGNHHETVSIGSLNKAFRDEDQPFKVALRLREEELPKILLIIVFRLLLKEPTE